MKRALLFGIDDYAFAPLTGCVSDALKMEEVLSTNDDSSKTGNFSCRVFTSNKKVITKELIYDKIEAYLDDHTGTITSVLVYFAGHGFVDNLDGYLVTQDAKRYSEGLRMSDLLDFCTRSRIPEIIIILDCCYAGAFGNKNEFNASVSQLPAGISILASSGTKQRSVEKNGSGLFTSLLYDALKGEAADILGNVNVASVYSYADSMLGAFDQRPTFKTNISSMTRLRKTKQKISRSDLDRLTGLFTKADELFPLDSSYEPDADPQNKVNEEIFDFLQKMTRNGLVQAVGHKHMYYAAIKNGFCSLTTLGKSYWKLMKRGHLVYKN